MLGRLAECRKIAVIIILWTLVALIFGLLVFNAQTEKQRSSAKSVSSKNAVRVFDYTSYDPKRKYRPVLSVHCDEFSATNGMLSIFNTGLHKVIHIQNLKIALFRYPNKNQSTSAKSASSSMSQLNENKSGDELMKSFSNFFDECKELQMRILDISNASQVCINGFNYNLLENRHNTLTISSMQAKFLSREPVLCLRGHVIIENENGDKLESNIINWDLQKQSFSVKGMYVLIRGQNKKIDKDACFDAALNFYNNTQAKNIKEPVECFAKIF